ncbi:phage head morphogenesis protein [Brevibacillus laterosporus]|nr:minor capsid protein [Brevibacillus laterosporus]TPG71160.1 phage head morphogenesis protein [Brevibacillus laterosporus]
MENSFEQEYWRNRFEQLAQESIEDTEKKSKEIIQIYEKASNEIIIAIFAFYGRWAVENTLTYQEAIKDLQGKEFKVWRMNIEQYVNQVNKTGDQKLLRELNGLALRSRINRLEELETRIKMILHDGAFKEQSTCTKHLTHTYQDQYYKTIYEVQKGIGLCYNFSNIDHRKLKMVLDHPWSGENYSNRIWNNREKLAQSIKEELTQKIIQGKSNRDIANSMASKMEVSKENAKKIIDTESAYLSTKASLDGYHESQIEEYENLATLDRRTSSICQKQDGKVYKLTEAVIGLNCPPFHTRCRTVTVPHLGAKTGTRIARDENGNNILVDANMTYEEWAEKYNVKAIE